MNERNKGNFKRAILVIKPIIVFGAAAMILIAFSIVAWKWEPFVVRVSGLIYLGALSCVVGVILIALLDQNKRFKERFQVSKYNMRWFVLFPMFFLFPVLGFILLILDSGVDIASIEFSVDSSVSGSYTIFFVAVIFFILSSMFIYFGFKILRGRAKLGRVKRGVLLMFSIIFIIVSPVIASQFYSFRGGSFAETYYPYSVGPFVQFGPYVDNKSADTSTSMVIWWFDPNRETVEFKYGTSPDTNSMVSVNDAITDGKRYEVHLSGLSPNTAYYFYISGFKDKVFNFTT
ncbi:MAG: fibronectin type III domain-containing protein, partial [Promethearchaeota archaeon]